MKNLHVFVLLFLSCLVTFSQEENLKEKEKALKASTNLTWEGNKEISEDNFIEAEVDYRKAISKSSENSAAPFNLGNAYYNKETYSEAFGRFKEAGEIAKSKEDKHKAYHNMGNVFMKRKDYAKAVESYKEALRNNPKDEETRYNLALAKELLKKDEEENKQNQDDKKEDKQNENKDDNEDQDKDKEGENKDQDKKEEGDKGEENKEKNEENNKGDGDEKKEQKQKPEQGDKEKQQQPRPNQLSKQQVENLLRAMQNAEKKVQDKIDEKKVKGVKIKNEKDW